MYNLKDIAQRAKAGKQLTYDEYAYLLANDREAFFAFLIANNPGSLNNILRHKLGYTHELGFKPDVAALTRICQMIVDKNTTDEIEAIITDFQFNEKGLSPKLIEALQNVFN